MGTEETLNRMFMGELIMELADEVRMFKPQSLKKVISLALLKDDQVRRMKKSHPPCSSGVTKERSSNATIKRLT